MRWRSWSSVPPTAPDSGVPSSRMPSSGARSAIVIHSAVAMRVLEGTTSVSTAAPPQAGGLDDGDVRPQATTDEQEQAVVDPIADAEGLERVA